MWNYDNKKLLCVKGAYESVLASCILTNDEKKAIIEKTAKSIFLFCAVVAVFAVCAITLYMFIKGTPAFKEVGVFDLLFGTVWKPTASNPSYGIWYIILSSLVATIFPVFKSTSATAAIKFCDHYPCVGCCSGFFFCEEA